MTIAKPAHLEARKLLLEHLDIHPGRTVPDDLDPAEVGIVGSEGHKRAGTSYHLGKADLKLDKRPYSVYESARDQRGLNQHASAMDIGEFRIKTKRGTFDLRHFSRWLVDLCRKGDPDTVDIREVIYSLDGKTVLRWDRLGIRSSGDLSHLAHTHVSEFRNADGRRMVRLVTRYLQHVGLLAGEDNDMQLDDKLTYVKAPDVQYAQPTTTVRAILPSTHYYVLQGRNEQRAAAAEARLRDEAILAAVTGGGHGQVLAAIAAEGERTRKLLEAQAAAEAARDAELLELARRAQSGEVDPKAVVDEIAARLSGQA